ncbi:ADP-forming succinate--CoA ligase subunit beta [Candidatus Gillettellia adelgis]
MNLHEYQAKKLFVRYGLPASTGYACTTPSEIESAISKIGCGPWVGKCQVHAGGRGKAGGVRVLYNKKEIDAFVAAWLGQRLVTSQTDALGQLVHTILIEKRIDIEKELYLGAVVDTGSCRVVFIASTEGGIEIEKIAQHAPELIYKITLDPLVGPQPYQGRELAFRLGLHGQQINKFAMIFMGLARLFLECDLAMAEINPLVVTQKGDLVCLDGRLSADSNALFRQPELRKMRDLSQEDERESRAAQWDLRYVALDGNIGCMVNGAGLAMGIMDIIESYGGKVANFLDVGGSATKERITEAFKIILSDDTVKVILVYIFGGIVRCDLVASGIINALSVVDVKIPVIVRLDGNNATLGTQKLIKYRLPIITTTSLDSAVQQVVSAAREKNNVDFNR